MTKKKSTISKEKTTLVVAEDPSAGVDTDGDFADFDIQLDLSHVKELASQPIAAKYEELVSKALTAEKAHHADAAVARAKAKKVLRADAKSRIQKKAAAMTAAFTGLGAKCQMTFSVDIERSFMFEGEEVSEAAKGAEAHYNRYSATVQFSALPKNPDPNSLNPMTKINIAFPLSFKYPKDVVALLRLEDSETKLGREAHETAVDLQREGSKAVQNAVTLVGTSVGSEVIKRKGRVGQAVEMGIKQVVAEAMATADQSAQKRLGSS